MKRQFKLERRQLELLKDFIKLWEKYNKGEKNDKYDDELILILEEYDFITYYRKWRNKYN